MTTATCHREDCPNTGVSAIVPPTLCGEVIICGGCGQPITDIVEA